MEKSLAEIRIEKGFTQEDMAHILGVTVPSYHYYETGKRKIPLKIVEKLCLSLEISREDFFSPNSFTIR